MDKVKYYQSKYDSIPGTDIREVRRNFEKIYDAKYHKNKRRQPYILAKYYGGAKVFTNDYFNHSGKERRRGDAMRRLKLFEAGADLLEHNTFPPILETNNRHGKGHRFAGKTRSGQVFFVQVQVRRGGSKFLMSTFPPN